MTEAHANATIIMGGVEYRVDQFRWSHSEFNDAPASSARMCPREVRVDVMYEFPIRAWLSVFPRVCWKCYDGRTRAHNRRCHRRGRRTEATAVLADIEKW